jgi:hypothetical protein
MHRPPLPRLVASSAAVLAALTTLSACGSDDDTGGGDAGSPDDGDYLAGDMEDWLGAVCLDDQIDEIDDPEPRGGEETTGGSYCVTSHPQGPGEFSYVEAYLYDADPSERYEPYSNYALGQVSADEWVVIWEDDLSGGDPLVEPHLEPLAELGFDVTVNGQPVG